MSRSKHKVGTQKEGLSGTIKFLEKVQKYRNVKGNENESGSWNSELKIGHEMKALAKFILAGLAMS